MKAKVLGLISKIAPVFASLALLVAVSNVNSTCLFMQGNSIYFLRFENPLKRC